MDAALSTKDIQNSGCGYPEVGMYANCRVDHRVHIRVDRLNAHADFLGYPRVDLHVVFRVNLRVDFRVDFQVDLRVDFRVVLRVGFHVDLGVDFRVDCRVRFRVDF